MPPPARSQDSMGRIFLLFLRLGLSSFGGPVAHLGYFRAEFVDRRRWLDDRSYAELLALCQFLPGPASSQVGMALGLGRAGFGGALAAWAGFTLPSALALILFAYGLTEYRALADAGWVHGLKVVAVAVVAQAVWGMAKTLCPDRPRVALALLAALLTLLLPSAWTQLAAIAATGLAGRWCLRLAPSAAAHPAPHAVSPRLGMTALGALVLLLLGLPLWASASASPSAALIDGVFRAGALVFGGGHVVLPLLQSATAAAGVVGNADFLAGYGAAQAVPGPLFSFAAFLGAVADWPLQGWRGGLVLLVVIFLPAFLVLLAALPFWERLRRRRRVQAALAGINAGVVGILLSALYDPVWTSAIHTRTDFALALACFGLLVPGRVPPAVVVGLAALAGQLAA